MVWIIFGTCVMLRIIVGYVIRGDVDIYREVEQGLSVGAGMETGLCLLADICLGWGGAYFFQGGRL